MGRATLCLCDYRRGQVISIHALRGEGDEVSFHFERMSLKFQSTPSVGRATIKWQQRKSLHLYFNPRPPWGGRPNKSLLLSLTRQFQSTPSVGRATAKLFVIDFDSIAISIHALRGEGDEHPKKTYAQDFFISIHALRGEGDDNAPDDIQDTGISIHALRGEGDETETEITQVWTISIHALRGEGDKVKAAFRISSFISIHALRGEGDWLRPLLKLALIISIHALRGEGDAAKVYTESLTKNFNPRPPWGGRHRLFLRLLL